MPQEKDRSEQMGDYYYNLKTDAEKIDFFFSIRCLNYLAPREEPYLSKYLTNEEKNNIYELEFQDFYMPTKEDEQGELVFDVEKCKKRIAAVAKYITELEYEAVKEYKKIYDSLPKDQKNRELAAAYMVQRSKQILLIKSFYHDNGPLDDIEAGEFNAYSEYNKVLREAENRMKQWMPKEERELFKTVVDLIERSELHASGSNLVRESKFLEGKKPKMAGLTEEELAALDDRSAKELFESADHNWADDKTMNDLPHFLNPQVSSDRNRRMENHYMALDNEKKIDYLEDGALARMAKVSIFNKNGEKTGELGLNPYSAVEKKIFAHTAEDFFKPAMENGTLALDTDEFEKRMDALADRIGSLMVKKGEFIKNGDMTGLMASTGINNRRYVADRICPEAIRAEAILDLFNNEALAADKKLIRTYCKKNGIKDNEALSDERLNDTFRKVFFDKSKNTAYGLPNGEEYHTLASKAGALENGGPTPEEKRKIEEASNEAKRILASEIRNKKSWLTPENGISKNSLKQLDNLYDQMKHADSKLHRNSQKYQKLLASLEKAHQKYMSFRESGRKYFSYKEKNELVNIYDDIAGRSAAYLKDKADKKRGSDLGQERYEIAFAAFHVTAGGQAKYEAAYHNRFRKAEGELKKKVSLKELIDRSGRDYNSQKEYVRRKKRNTNQKAPANNRRMVGSF